MALNKTTIFVAAAIVVGLIIIQSVNNPADADAGSGQGADVVSQSQLSQTENFEGFSATAYKDGTSSSGTQLYSIGYGHQIQPSETNLLTATISQATAQQMLLNDMQNVIDFLNNTGDFFTQGQFDALADFGYNEGTGALQNVITVFENQGASAVPAVLQQYIYWHPTPGGAAVVNQNLVTRRNSEIATFNS